MKTDRLPEPSRQSAERALAESEHSSHRQEVVSKRSEATPIRLVDSLRTALEGRNGLCKKHGDFVESGYRLGVRTVREIWQGCPTCAAERLAAEQAAIEAKALLQAMDRRQSEIHSAAIPLRFRTRDFASFVADTGAKQKALDIARDYANQFPAREKKGQGLVFSGQPGTGKSHLAAAIMLDLINGKRLVQYVGCMSLIRAVRETWRKGSEQSERAVLAHFGESVDLLVIDEVGVQYGSDSEQTILFEILDRRYAEMRPTIMLTNQDRTGFKAFVGDRVFDRLGETCRWVTFDWESYRPTARHEAAAR